MFSKGQRIYSALVLMFAVAFFLISNLLLRVALGDLPVEVRNAYGWVAMDTTMLNGFLLAMMGFDLRKWTEGVGSAILGLLIFGFAGLFRLTQSQTLWPDSALLVISTCQMLNILLHDPDRGTAFY
jgi:hypothetical protein